ncbi:Dehydrogenase/reductase SDR family member on chromosome X [Echria macrotheca]|uniref:Dehydrogenase/reductase SDR family member on chromosome X n=1 Tax=Echria macrotheca TaxID=438768 RepID=A0AAJ0BEL7_9PEZI|nr:Dehydrogenase/reductase SDR family member on chromosome X [Echria macrotheca]
MSDALRPYASLYEDPEGPGDARPTVFQVIEDNDVVGKWQGRVVLVTGGTSGIGTTTVKALHQTGADVYFTARDADKGQKTVDAVRKESSGSGKLDFVLMDLDSLESVKEGANTFLGRSGGKLNVLINNAGVLAGPEKRTKEGFESQFGVNHLAHFVLICMVLPALVKSSTAEFNSRVICLTSSAHRASPVLFDDPNFEKPGSYNPMLAYGQSKTANAWTANYIDRVYGPRGVHANAVHPGAVLSGLFVHLDPAIMAEWEKDPKLMAAAQTAEQGAATTVWAAVSPVWEGKGGEYLADCQIGAPTDDLTSILSAGTAPWAKDVEGEDRLWKLSEELTGVRVAL